MAGVLVFLRDRQKTLKFLRIVESAIVEKVSPVLEAGLMAGQSRCPWWHLRWHSSRPGCPGNLRQDKVRGVGEGKSTPPPPSGQVIVKISPQGSIFGVILPFYGEGLISASPQCHVPSQPCSSDTWGNSEC